jgi:hypothetical protein
VYDVATRRKPAASKSAESIEPTEAAARVISRLAERGGARVTTLVDRAIEHVLERPIAAFVDVDELTDIVVATVTSGNAHRLAERHLKPGRLRQQAWLKGRKETPSDWMGKEARTELEAIVRELKPPRGKWLDGAVDPADVRQLVSPVIQETLTRFVQKLPIPGVSGPAAGTGTGGSSAGLGSKLLSGFGRSAEKLVDAGRSVLGGLGAEMEQRFAAVARDFSQSATGEMRGAFADRARSDEGKRLLARMRQQALSHVLGTPVATIVADGEKLPWDDLIALVEPIAGHLHGYAPFRAAVRHELEALIAVEGAHTLKSRLEEAGLLEQVRVALSGRAATEVTTFVESAAFVGWLNELLGE